MIKKVRTDEGKEKAENEVNHEIILEWKNVPDDKKNHFIEKSN
jgi:hypothetical protein